MRLRDITLFERSRLEEKSNKSKYKTLADELETYANKHISKSEQGFGDFMYHAELIRKGHENIHKKDLKTVQHKYRKIMDDMISQHLGESIPRKGSTL